MQPTPTLTARQLWGQMSTRTPEPGTRDWCTPVILPTGGVLFLADNITTSLKARATYLLPCDSGEAILSPDTTGNSTVIGFTEPFYASIAPQIFALATATVISYVLVILIFITPRTFYVGGPGGGGGFLSRHGLSSSNPVVGVGRRPLLQKVATIGVATSLTIAAADTFHVAQRQYHDGYMDSSALVDDVVNTVLIRVVRIISDSFIWLAQVQTLIRLFPRHKEKVTIKWLGFALVSADIIFSILDSFLGDNPRTRPQSFQDAIPALNYLFELAISLIYASCVIYYSLSKRRFAFWHPKMRNICLVALMSLMSVLIPVVFFVLDISLPAIAGWGEYIRWVGAASAAVIVWEWVERIESLERDERKDGILGREIFDGDEMLARTSDEGRFGGRGKGDDGDLEKSAGFMQQIKQARTKLPLRRRRKRPPGDHHEGSGDQPSTGMTTTTSGEPLVPPQPALSPPSRSDTASATSTVYAVRYHNLTSPSPGAPEPVPEQPEPPSEPAAVAPKDISDSSTDDPPLVKDPEPETTDSNARPRVWASVPNPFKRRRAEPPAEVADAQMASGVRRSPIDRTLNLRDRLGVFAAHQRDRFGRSGSGPTPPLPVMVIPAPKNDRTWSPDDVRGSVSTGATTQEHGEGQAGPSDHSRQASHATTTTTESGAGNNVVVIPAPRRGQTWSPQEQSHGRQSRTPTQRRTPPQNRDQTTPTPQANAAASTTPPQPARGGTSVISTPRGALTIEEDPSRHSPQRHSSNRRNTHPRRPPIAIRTGDVPNNVEATASLPNHPPTETPITGGGSETRDFHPSAVPQPPPPPPAASRPPIPHTPPPPLPTSPPAQPPVPALAQGQAPSSNEPSAQSSQIPGGTSSGQHRGSNDTDATVRESAGRNEGAGAKGGGEERT